jgi:hypothetical protein
MKTRLRWWRKVSYARILQRARVLFVRFGSRPGRERILGQFVTLSDVFRDTFERFFHKEGVKRGLLFGLGAFLIVGVLALLLVAPSSFSPA